MKKINKLSLVLGLVLGVFATSASATEEVRMGTISPGSSSYQVMSTMASMVNRADVGLEVKVDATGSAAKHQIDLAKSNLDLAMSAPELYGFLQRGDKMYKRIKTAPELSKNIGLLFWFPYGAFHFLTYADSDVKTLKDIKGKRVFLGPPGGGAQATAAAWVEAVTGYKAGKDYESVRASWSSALQGFQDRQFDVYVTGGIPPFPQVEQLAMTSKLRLLGLTKDEVDHATPAMMKPTKVLGRFLDKIPAGTYKNVQTNSEVYTIGATVGVVARMDLPADTVYKITKAFWSQLDQEAKNAPYLKRVTLDKALSATNMKLHPGALRYYKEIGLKIPEKLQQ